MSISIIIATNCRHEHLKECLDSLLRQSVLPGELIISHGGGDLETMLVSQEKKYELLHVKYFNFGSLGAARQRNLGADQSCGDILFFLDDDVICESNFIEEIMSIFEKDEAQRIGGVCGIINGGSYVPLSRINTIFFELCLDRFERSSDYAGKVVGPAVNFWPKDIPNCVQDVQWMASTACAYRRDIFFKHYFKNEFYGYSFMEDVELSCRVAKSHRLVNTTKARVFHKDLGGKTHKNWIDIGVMQVINRWFVASEVLGKDSAIDFIRFVYYQMYCMAAESKYLVTMPYVWSTFTRWLGRWLGILKLLFRFLCQTLVRK